jgi:hypothetical protein
VHLTAEGHAAGRTLLQLPYNFLARFTNAWGWFLSVSWFERISEWLGANKAKVWVAHLEPYDSRIPEELPFAHGLCVASDCVKEYVICRRPQDFYNPTETAQILETIVETTRAFHPTHFPVLTGSINWTPAAERHRSILGSPRNRPNTDRTSL